jgi:ubiquinone/menaquinone biosynthesis C-methylase UbiE
VNHLQEEFTNSGRQLTKEEETFWNEQTKNKYESYEKKVYSAFREKEYIDMLQKGLSDFDQRESGKVLDMGCGTGVSSIVISNLGFDVTGIDISSNLIDQAIKLSEDATVSWLKDSLLRSNSLTNKPTFIVGDITNLDVADNSIDICFLCGVLHHFPNYEAVLKETNRVLKKDGIMIAVESNLLNWTYRLSFYLVNKKKGVTPNEYPLSPIEVEKRVNKYFTNVRLSQFRENDVPFLRQIGWLGNGLSGNIIRKTVLVLKNNFMPKISRGTFFIVSCKK